MSQRPRPASPAQVAAAQVAAALAASADLGLFFGFGDPAASNPAASDPAWQPASLLYAPGPGPLDELIESARISLGGCEPRVAASLFFQGYAARLLSPQLGCLATSGLIPVVPQGQLRWRQGVTRSIELGLTAGPGWQGPASELASQVLTSTFDQHLQPLITATSARIRIPASVLRDNAVSAFIGALRLLDRRLPSGWRSLAAAALADPWLRESGSIRNTEPAFVRRSCCLFYRAANGGKCGDCPLHDGKLDAGFPAAS
jgi:hypothetical protein